MSFLVTLPPASQCICLLAVPPCSAVAWRVWWRTTRQPMTATDDTALVALRWARLTVGLGAVAAAIGCATFCGCAWDCVFHYHGWAPPRRFSDPCFHNLRTLAGPVYLGAFLLTWGAVQLLAMKLLTARWLAVSRMPTSPSTSGGGSSAAGEAETTGGAP